MVHFLLADFCIHSSLTTFAKCSECTIIEFFRMNFKIGVDETRYLYLSVRSINKITLKINNNAKVLKILMNRFAI